EVKGCTLLNERTALFPDAPTTRGTRHMLELEELVERGESAAVMFLVFPQGAECFAANGDTDPDFAEAFHSAGKAGVEVFPMKLNFDGERVFFIRRLRVSRMK
ncbi:MAG: sugar fermentation stimulation protein SfsA, partial [Candidatus Aegiribacteria sp.]|nr:sugar fermentation stimulation protein SfsA [Candidatus Aegiribacteria sp.]